MKGQVRVKGRSDDGQVVSRKLGDSQVKTKTLKELDVGGHLLLSLVPDRLGL